MIFIFTPHPNHNDSLFAVFRYIRQEIDVSQCLDTVRFPHRPQYKHPKSMWGLLLLSPSVVKESYRPKRAQSRYVFKQKSGSALF